MEFLNSIESIRSCTFKPSTIISSFGKTRLIPFNPEIVLAKLSSAEQEISSADTSHTTPSPQTVDLTSTPQTIQTLRYQANALQAQIDSELDLRKLSSTTTKSLETFIKGSLLQAQCGAQELS